MARKKTRNKTTGSGKRTAAKKRKKRAGRSASKPTRRAKAKATARRKVSGAKRKRAFRPAGAAAARPAPNRAAVTRVSLEARAADESVRLQAFQDALAALTEIEQRLRGNLTGTPTDDDELKPNLAAIGNAKHTFEAKIAAAMTGTLAPPTAAAVTLLQDAIKDAEGVIRQSASVNQLIRAATALIETLNA